VEESQRDFLMGWGGTTETERMPNLFEVGFRTGYRKAEEW
jgi:hypothetical protein